MKLQYLFAVSVVFFLIAGCKSESPVAHSSKDTHTGDVPYTDLDKETILNGAGGTDGGTLTGGGGHNSTDGGLIAHFKPALVIRGSGCIMCHARVESNIITDFGYGNDYFGGGVGPGISSLSGAIYGNHGDNWSTAKVWGQIIVPQTTETFIGNTLGHYLRNQVTAPDASTAAPEVVEKALVYIGAPTADRIRQVGGVFPVSHPKWVYKSQAIGVDVSGIEMATGSNYVRNVEGGELVCSGDLVIDGVLFLNNLQLRTDNKGCRIYVTQSVFIQGPITYLGSSEKRNLQITSARAIVMGLGPSSAGYNTLHHRFRDIWTHAAYFTRETGQSTQEKLESIITESSYIPEISDAAMQAPLYRDVAFERLFLNAPNYQSRYLGEFKGVIVAEMAIGSLGNFAFRFDPVFDSVPILPLLQEYEYLKIE